MSDAVRRAVTRGRKPYLIFAVSMVAVLAGMIACEDGIRNSLEVGREKVAQAEPATASLKANPYASVGAEHNEAMDFVLREFAKKWKKNMKKADICAALNEITTKYLARKGKNPAVDRFYSPLDPCASDDGSLRAGGQSQLREANAADDNFSPRALDLVNQVQSIMVTSGSAEDVANSLVAINSEAMNSLGGNDAALVLGVSAIAQSSAAYWEANLNNWVTVYSEGGGYLPPLPFLQASETASKTSFPAAQIDRSGIGDVGWADVGGGIVGGIRGALGGPGGILLGIGTGAAYSSIGAAIGQIVRIIQRIRPL